MKKLFAGSLLAMIAAATCAEDAQGQWGGKIADELGVVLTVSKADGGKWKATFGAPSQFSSSEVERFATDATHISFAISAVKASYQATWDEQAKAWTGTWTQGQSVPLKLRRLDAGALAALQPKRPQVQAVAAAAAYHSHEVRFANTAAQVQLAGSLSVPKGAGPWPAVVLVHGSGPLTRDEDILGHKIFMVLADHLTRQGIAVLRYDKRGIGASTGNYMAATTLDFAADAQAAIAFLRTRPEIDARHLGIVGHSEGGLIAPVVAAREPQLGFIVMMGAPGVRGELIMTEQLALGAASKGVGEDLIGKQRAMNKALFAALVAERDPVQAQRTAMAILQQAERDGLATPGTAEATSKQYTSPWFNAFLRLDPGPALQAMRQPALVLNGELDRQVPARLNLDAIRLALANNPRAVVKELPKLNHLFQTAKTGSTDEYAQIEETLAPSALALMADWIRTQVQ